MQNDILLSGLLNLFALLSTKYGINIDKCLTLINSFLCGHFGRNTEDTYIGLFTDLYDFYAENEVDIDTIVLGISSSMRSELELSEQKLIQLRLMEFCKDVDSNSDANDPLLRSIGNYFGVDDELYQKFIDFVDRRPSEVVKAQHFDGYDGTIYTLWLEEEHRMLFTYDGNDELLMNDVPVLSGVFQAWQESCVVKNHKGASLYFTTIHQAYLGDKTSRVEFCGRDLNFRYPGTDVGLHDFSFTLNSGELVAIMGGSGTGKTTLLSILNGTLKAQEGTITINGHEASSPQAKELIGFVPQDDLLIEELTVYENLFYTAQLCFDGMSKEEIDRRCQEVLVNLGLEAIRDLKVGSALNKTISGGQRKRVNIALELIRQPAVLMLDEPTSGLSSADTEHVIGLLKEQTYRDCLVIVNIHQPSSDVYKLFDRLWVLDRGGYPVFDGNPIDAITYFKHASGYADADVSMCPNCGNVKPEAVLSIIDEKALDKTGRITTARKTSPERWHEMYLEAIGESPEVTMGEIPHSDQRKPGVLRQFLIQLRRNIATKAANRQYLLITLLEAPLLAIICALLTRYAPEKGYSLLDNKNFVSFLFMAVIVSTFVGMSASAEEIFRDRALLKRERFLHLSYASYISSKIILLAAVSLLQTGIFVLIGQWVMQFHDLFFEWWLVLFATSFVANLTGLLLSQCLNSIVAIYITIPLLLIPQILLCGVVVDFNDLGKRSTTGNVPVIGNVIPARWAFEALAVTSFADNEYEQPLFEAHLQHYQNEYYRLSYLNELESQLERMADEQEKGKQVDPQHLLVIRTEMPRLAEVSGLEPYAGDYSYESVKDYFRQADAVFAERGNRATLEADRLVCQRIEEIGREANRELRLTHTNQKLESVLTNATATEDNIIIDGHIVPQIGQVWLDPVSHLAGAPFYASYKYIGTWKVKTLWMNLAVLLLMAMITASLVYTDRPGRYMRKLKN